MEKSKVELSAMLIDGGEKKKNRLHISKPPSEKGPSFLPERLEAAAPHEHPESAILLKTSKSLALRVPPDHRFVLEGSHQMLLTASSGRLDQRQSPLRFDESAKVSSIIDKSTAWPAAATFSL